MRQRVERTALGAIRRRQIDTLTMIGGHIKIEVANASLNMKRKPSVYGSPQANEVPFDNSLAERDIRMVKASMRTSKRINVSDKDEAELNQIVRNGNTPQKIALRARIFELQVLPQNCP